MTSSDLANKGQLWDRYRPVQATANTIQGRHNNDISRLTVLNLISDHGFVLEERTIGSLLNERRRPLKRIWEASLSKTDSKECFREEYLLVKIHNFISFDTMIELECVGERERFQLDCVCEMDRFGRGYVMVWGAIRFSFILLLLVIIGFLTARCYTDIILKG